MSETECIELNDTYMQKMDAVLTAFINYLKTIRTGRAYLGAFEDLKVDYHDNKVPINQIASLKIASPQVVLIDIWDQSAKKAIEKAILKSPLGLNPIDQANQLKIVFPALNEESRNAIIKNLKSKLEIYKLSIRNIRKDLIQNIKKFKKTCSEDFIKKLESKIQNNTDEYIKKLDHIFSMKSKEIQTL